LEAEAINLASYIFLREGGKIQFELDFLTKGLIEKIPSGDYAVSDKVFPLMVKYGDGLYTNKHADFGKNKGYKLNVTKDFEFANFLKGYYKSVHKVNVGEVNVTSNNVNSVLGTKESIDKRRVILAVCVFVAMFAVIFTVLFASNTTKNENVKVSDVDYLEAYHIALSKYYETDDIDDVILLLQEHKNDSEKIEEMQKKTRITCDSLLLTYISEKIDSKEEFEDVTKKYEVFLYGLNNYAKAKVGNNEIKALPDRDYMELTNQFNKIYNDGMIFFDSLDLYNKKDYNKAYSNFELIDNENTYYDNAVYYMSKIVDNILELMEKDIKKLENGVDELSIDDKIERYVQIEEVILGYDRAYVSVNLSKNSSYKKSLASCRELIDEYSRVPTEDKGEE
jgi:hypothetical protein